MKLIECVGDDYDVILPNGEAYRSVKAFVFFDKSIKAFMAYFSLSSKLQSYDIIRKKSDGETFRLCRMPPQSEMNKKADVAACEAFHYEIVTQ